MCLSWYMTIDNLPDVGTDGVVAAEVMNTGVVDVVGATVVVPKIKQNVFILNTIIL